MIRGIIFVFLLGLTPLLSKDRNEISQVFFQNQLFGEAQFKKDNYTCNDLMIHQYGLIPGQKTWIENYVNIASGQNTFSKVLNLAPAKEPIYLSMFYHSYQNHDESGGTWTISPHHYLISRRGTRGEKSNFTAIWMHDEDGSLLHFSTKRIHKEGAVRELENHNVAGTSNFLKGSLESNNHRNYKLFYNRDQDIFWLETANGTKREYHRINYDVFADDMLNRLHGYVLRKELRPSGAVVIYNNDQYGRPRSIESWRPDRKKRFAKVSLVYEGPPSKSRNFKAINHNHQTFHFSFQKTPCQNFLGFKTKKSRYLLEHCFQPYGNPLKCNHKRLSLTEKDDLNMAEARDDTIVSILLCKSDEC